MSSSWSYHDSKNKNVDNFTFCSRFLWRASCSAGRRCPSNRLRPRRRNSNRPHPLRQPSSKNSISSLYFTRQMSGCFNLIFVQNMFKPTKLLRFCFSFSPPAVFASFSSGRCQLLEAYNYALDITFNVHFVQLSTPLMNIVYLVQMSSNCFPPTVMFEIFLCSSSIWQKQGQSCFQ